MIVLQNSGSGLGVIWGEDGVFSPKVKASLMPDRAEELTAHTELFVVT